MIDRIKKKKNNFLNEIIKNTELLSYNNHPEVTLDDLNELNIGVNYDFKTVNKVVNERVEKTNAMKSIDAKLSDALRLAEIHGFDNMCKQLKELKHKISKKIK